MFSSMLVFGFMFDVQVNENENMILKLMFLNVWYTLCFLLALSIYIVTIYKPKLNGTITYKGI
jgi:hypothetical protein